jgi:hypothetical protein
MEFGAGIGVESYGTVGGRLTKWRDEDGSPGRIRTSDMTVNSRPLYRLSYRGVFGYLREPELLSIYAHRWEIKYSSCSPTL